MPTSELLIIGAAILAVLLSCEFLINLADSKPSIPSGSR